jgi:hypothetical protein
MMDDQRIVDRRSDTDRAPCGCARGRQTLRAFATAHSEGDVRFASNASCLAGLIAAQTLLSCAPVTRPRISATTYDPEVHVQSTNLEIPESIRVEHDEIHAELVRATKRPGSVGEAARELAAILHAHFVREEEIALPPLALLAPLARGEITSEMREVLPMTAALRAELPRMLDEHRAIGAATGRLGEVARTEGNADVERLATKLALHAKSEEELLYPAAILVGDVVRARLRQTATR